MSAWKWLCLAEAIAIALVWLLPVSTEPSTTPKEFGHVAPERLAAAPSLRPPGEGSRIVAATAEPDLPPSRPQDLRPWSSGTDAISLLVAVLDEAGAPVLDGYGDSQQDGDEKPRSFSLDSDHRLLIANLRAGRIQFNLRANGFRPFQKEFQLSPAPAVQRLTLSLERAGRVLLYLRTSTGELLQDWARRELERSTSDLPISAQLLREPAAGNLPAKAMRPRGNELGEFLSSSWARQSLPRDCAGAFDLRAEPPLHASAWLGRLYLGTQVIEQGAQQIVILVDEAALLRSLADLRLRVVDDATGEALPHAEARLDFAWGGSSLSSTSQDGVIQFQRVVPEIRNLTVHLRGYADTYRELQLDPGLALDLGDIPLSRAGRIHARLLGPDGAPAANEMFLFFPTGTWARPEEPLGSASHTDTEGWIEFQAGTERHQAIFGGTTYALQAVVWEHGTTEAKAREIHLLRGAKVRLLAVAPEGQSRLIWLLDAEGRLLSSSRQAVPVAWPVQLAAGAYLLRVEDLDRNLLGTLDLRVPEGGGDLEVALP